MSCVCQKGEGLVEWSHVVAASVSGDKITQPCLHLFEMSVLNTAHNVGLNLWVICDKISWISGTISQKLVKISWLSIWGPVYHHVALRPSISWKEKERKGKARVVPSFLSISATLPIHHAGSQECEIWRRKEGSHARRRKSVLGQKDLPWTDSDKNLWCIMNTVYS